MDNIVSSLKSWTTKPFHDDTLTLWDYVLISIIVNCISFCWVQVMNHVKAGIDL